MIFEQRFFFHVLTEIQTISLIMVENCFLKFFISMYFLFVNSRWFNTIYNRAKTKILHEMTTKWIFFWFNFLNYKFLFWEIYISSSIKFVFLDCMFVLFLRDQSFVNFIVVIVHYCILIVWFSFSFSTVLKATVCIVFI